MLELKNISIEFAKKNIINDFSLKINKGDKVVIKGDSGRGKSTLFRMLLGFIPYSNGEILIDDKLIKPNSIVKLRNMMAYADQDLSLPNTNMDLFLEEIKTYKHNYFNGIDEQLLDELELDKELLTKHTSNLSGGEKQRLALAIALSLNKEIILLDEITNQLPYKLKVKIANYLLKLDNTVVVISHDNVFDSFKEVIL